MTAASFYPGPFTVTGEAFRKAETFLAGGKSKTDRPVANNTRLRRVDADTIALVFHQTAVVTYHRDGRFTIYGGGWNSVTTKARIRTYSPVRHLFSVSGEWVVGYTGELTPPRVQKCRTCKGRGRWVEPDYCYGPRYCYTAWEGHPCKHGSTTGGHRPDTCEHGHTARHTIGESERVCYRCKGEGRTDYGSKRIPILVSPSCAFTVDDTGAYVGEAATPDAPGSGYAPVKHTAPSYTPSYSYGPTYASGDTIVSTLATLVPAVRAEVRHPVTGDMAPVHAVIVSLNDSHRWTREQVADWLDTLDVDLRFPAGPDTTTTEENAS